MSKLFHSVLPAILFAFLLFPAASHGQSQTPPSCLTSCTKWAVCELEFSTVNNTFSESFLYTSIRMSATINGGSPGETKTVPGFFHKKETTGHGKFKIRFTPTQEGNYHYSTSSAYQGLGGQSGDFFCGGVQTLPEGGTNHGFLRRDPNNSSRGFVWDDTARAFLWGQTYYQIVNQARYGSATTWQTALTNTQNRKMNKVRLLVSPWSAAPFTTETQPFLRTASDSNSDGKLDMNHDQLDLEHWNALDKVVQLLYEKGVAAEVIIFRDPLLLPGERCPCPAGVCESFFGTDEQDKRYLRYVMARYAAYPNVVWSLSNEWQCTSKTESYFDGIGACIRSGCTDSGGRTIEADPWFAQGTSYRPLTIHPYVQGDAGKCFDFLDKSWPVHGSLQYHKTTLPGDTWGQDSIACNRRADATSCPAPSAAARNIPFINDEYGYFGDVDRMQQRNAMWGIATAGGYGTAGDLRPVPGTTTGCTPIPPATTCAAPISSTIWESANEYGDIQRMIDFFTLRSIPYWTMTGLDTCGETDRAHVLADPTRNNYVLYLASESTFTVSQLNTGAYDAVWYNPRITTTDITECKTVTAAKTITAPPAGAATCGVPPCDWALWLKKRATACP